MIQKILIHNDRKPGKRAQDVLYIHDTIELFAEQQETLANLWRKQVADSLTSKQARAVKETARELFFSVNDTLRNAAVIPQERRLDPERIRALCNAVLGKLLAENTRRALRPGRPAFARSRRAADCQSDLTRQIPFARPGPE